MMTSIEMRNGSVVNSMHDDTYNIDKEQGRTYSQQSVSSLVVLSLDASSYDPLIEYCKKNKNTHLFLRWTANYWPVNSGVCDIDKLLFLLTRCVNIGSSVVNFVFVWYALFAASYPNDSLRYASAGVDLAIVIRTVSVLPVQFFNQRRLTKAAHPQDVLALEESVRIASIFGAISTCSNILGTVLLANSSVSYNAAVFLTEYFLAAYLIFNMFFLILDIKVSSLLLDQLHLLADNKQLTMGESRWASDLIIVPCLASVVAIAILVLFFLDKGVDARVTRDTVAFIAYMMKELVFVAVAFWYIAQVNAKADELTVKLSRSVWGVYDLENDICGDNKPNSTVVMSEQTEANSLLSRIPQLSDIYRLSIHASGMSEPISFTLLFKRLTWLNVAVSAGGFCFTLLVALIKSLLGF